MSDIFISYASEERDRVLPLVSALEKTGWSIFWDRTIPAGKTWRQVIGFEIRTCRSVLVVWTENSVTSEWVLEEAETGKRRGILIPVLLDNVEPPFGFGNIQAANLTAWNGDSLAPTFTHLVADITTILGEPPTVVKEPEERRSDTEAQRKAEGERPQQEYQPSDKDAGRQGEEEKQEQIEREANRARLPDEERLPPEAEQARKKSPAPSQHAPERQGGSVPEHRDRRRLYAGGAALIVIGVVVAFWFLGSFGGKDAEVKKIVSLRGETRPAEMVRGETPPAKADVAQVATKVQEHIKTAGSYRDRGDYSPALAELAKAKSLDPANKAVLSELESTTKACLAEQRIVLANLRCE
jgi:hypothetical protein